MRGNLSLIATVAGGLLLGATHGALADHSRDGGDRDGRDQRIERHIERERRELHREREREEWREREREDWREIINGVAMSLDQTLRFERERGRMGQSDDWHDRTTGIEGALQKGIGKWMP